MINACMSVGKSATGKALSTGEAVQAFDDLPGGDLLLVALATTQTAYAVAPDVADYRALARQDLRLAIVGHAAWLA